MVLCFLKEKSSNILAWHSNNTLSFYPLLPCIFNHRNSKQKLSVLTPACACVFFGPQRIFQNFQFCDKHFQIVRFCIEIQISFLSGIKKKKSDYLWHNFSSQCNAGVETRSQFLASQLWTGVECLSHWRLLALLSLTVPLPSLPSPACVHYSAPTGGWV